MRTIVTTKALAEAVGTTPDAIRAALHRLGHYCGMRPEHTSPKRMHWPRNAVAQVRRYKARQAEEAAIRREANRKKWIVHTCKRRMALRAAEGRTQYQSKHRQTVNTEKIRVALMSAFVATI